MLTRKQLASVRILVRNRINSMIALFKSRDPENIENAFFETLNCILGYQECELQRSGESYDSLCSIKNVLHSVVTLGDIHFLTRYGFELESDQEENIESIKESIRREAKNYFGQILKRKNSTLFFIWMRLCNSENSFTPNYFNSSDSSDSSFSVSPQSPMANGRGAVSPPVRV